MDSKAIEENCPTEDDQQQTSALRVSQLDADEIDNELCEIVLNQYKRILDNLSVSDLSRFDPEAIAVFRFLFWWYSMRINKCTIGQDMMDMSYVAMSSTDNNRIFTCSENYAYLSLTVLAPYIRQRLSDIVGIFNENLANYIDQRLLTRLDIMLEFFNTLHFLYFLNKGGYRSLLERLLRLKAVHNSQPVLGEMDFTVMNRELIWHGFADLLVLVVPWLKFGKIWNYLKRRVFRSKTKTANDGDNDSSDVRLDSDTYESSMIISKDFVSTCVVCQNFPVLPCHIGCGHCFCYYCLKANVDEDSSFECPDCGCSAKSSRIVFLCASNVSL